MERWDVVVVGAGAAGLACAKALAAAGFRVVVLDARSRIGGRIHTLRTGAGPIELGAQVIHPTAGSALDLLVLEAGLPTQPLSRDAAVIVVDRRRRWDAAALMRERAPAPWLVERQLAGLSGGTVGMALAAVLGPAQELAAAWLEQSIGGELGRLDLDGLAAQTRGRSAGPERMLPGGFDQVPTALADGVDLRLDCPVSTVRTVGPSVETAAGSVLTAAAVVVTVPLSVVLADGLRFEPPLPETRIAAARQLVSSDGLAVVLHTAPAPSSSWVLLARPPWGMWRTAAGSTALAGHVKGPRTVKASDIMGHHARQCLSGPSKTALRIWAGWSRSCCCSAHRGRAIAMCGVVDSWLR